jgi:pimeloyl-ACP methyl ester carboxylesterase
MRSIWRGSAKRGRIFFSALIPASSAGQPADSTRLPRPGARRLGASGPGLRRAQTPAFPAPRRAALAEPGRIGDRGGAWEPWPAEFVELPSGRRLHLRRTPAERGAPARRRFVFVHGLGGSATNWTELAGLLAPLGEGVAIDLPGFGRSPAPGRGGWSHEEQIGAAIECIEHLGRAAPDWEPDHGLGPTSVRHPGSAPERQPGPARPVEPVHLVGNSMGGAVALAVAARRPDLVRSLTLVSPAVPDLRFIAQLRRTPVPLLLLPGASRMAQRQMPRMSVRERVAFTLALCVGEPERLSAAHFAQAEREAAERAAVVGAARGEVAALRSLVRAQLRAGDRSMWALARRVQAPALVVWGARDLLVSADLAPRLCAALPDSRLLLLPGAGHVAMIERPAEVARAMAVLVEGSGAVDDSGGVDGSGVEESGVPA